MLVYLFVILLNTVLVCHYDIGGGIKYKSFWYRLVLVVLILVAGLRYRVGADSIVYTYDFYHTVPELSKIDFSEIFIQKYEPGFFLLLSLVKTMGLRFYVVNFIQALIVNVLVFKYIKKHSAFPYAVVWLYTLYLYTIFNYEEMRSSISLVFALFGNDYILSKKWIKGIFLYLLGAMFHYSVLIMLIIPFAMFLKMNTFGYMLMIMALAFGYLLQHIFADYLALFEFNAHLSEKASFYANSENKIEQQLPLWAISLVKIPYLLYCVFSVSYIKRHIVQCKNLIRFEPFIVLGLMFVLMSIPMPIFYRFARYFEFYFLLVFANAFAGLVRNNIRKMKTLALVRAFVFFVPLLNAISYNYRHTISESTSTHKIYHYQKLYPYCSIIEKGIDHDREYFFKSWAVVSYPSPNEY